MLPCPYVYDKARLIVREMTDLLSYDLAAKGLVTDQLVLTVGYDAECLRDPDIRRAYHGPVTTDHYGRKTPKSAHGTQNLSAPTCSTKKLLEAVTALYERITDPGLLVRRITIAACRLQAEHALPEQPFEQLDLFTTQQEQRAREQETAALERERRLQQAVLGIRSRFGKNAILKGMNLEDGATTAERNRQIGGHKA